MPHIIYHLQSFLSVGPDILEFIVIPMELGFVLLCNKSVVIEAQEFADSMDWIDFIY